MAGFKDIAVTDELLPYFLGWLEFAGTKPNPLFMVVHSPDWPEHFKVDRLPDQPADRVKMVNRFRVTSPDWPDGTADPDWKPKFHGEGYEIR